MSTGKLRLEVVLAAIDKATRPIRSVMGSSKGLSKQLKDTRDQLKELNAAQQKLGAFAHLKKGQQDVALSMQKTQERTRELAVRLNEAKQAAKPMQDAFTAAHSRTEQLRASQKQLTQQIREQQVELGRTNATWEKQRVKITAMQTLLNKNPTEKLRAEYKQLTEAQVQSLAQVRALESGLKQLKSQKRDGARELFKYRGELQHLKGAAKEAATTVNRLGADFDSSREQARKLKDQHSRQRQELDLLRRSLKSAGISTTQMSGSQSKLREDVRKTNESINRQQEHLAKLANKQNRMRASRSSYDQGRGMRDRVAGAGAATMGAGTVVGLPIVKMVRDYSSYEDAMLGVARQVEGARDANGRLTATYYEMGDAIKAMSETIPMATTEIAALVEGGARMGVQGKENLLAFARTAALASTAFDLPADQISEDLGKIANVFKVPIKNISQLGDVINYLDDNAQSKGADIIDVMQRVAGSVGSMDYKEAAALGSTFLSLGASSEVAASATKAMVRELAIAEKQPGRFRKGLKELGMDAKKVQADMAKDSTSTLLKVMEAVRKLPKAKQMGVMVDLFGKEFGDDAAKLAENLDEYRKQLALVKDQKAAGSMQREGDAKNDTLSADWQKTQNKLFNQSSEMGKALRQPLMDVMDGVSEVMASIGSWTKANPELAASLIKIAAVLAVVLVASGSLMVGIAGLLGPILLAKFAMAGLGIQLTSGIGIMGKLGGAIGVVIKAVAWLSRLLLLNPIGIAVTVIAGGAYLIWRNWDTLGPKFSRLWEGVKSGASRMWDGIKGAASSAFSAVSTAASAVWSSIRQAFSGGIMGVSMLILNWSPLGLFYQAMAGVLSWFGISLPARFTDFGRNMLQGLVNGITSALGAVKAAITGAGESAVGWFKEKLGIHSPSRVFASLGGFTMAGLAQGIEGGQGGALGAVMSVAKKLTAAGAGIALGATSAVAGAASVAIDHRPPIAAAAPATTGAGQIIAPTINVYPTPGMNEQKLAELVAREVEKLQRQAAARGRSRLTDKD